MSSANIANLTSSFPIAYPLSASPPSYVNSKEMFSYFFYLIYNTFKFFRQFSILFLDTFTKSKYIFSIAAKTCS